MGESKIVPSSEMGMGEKKDVKGFSEGVELIKRGNPEDKIDKGDAYFSTPVGEVIVEKIPDEKGQLGGYDTESNAVAKIPGIGDIKLVGMYYAKNQIERILAAHGHYNAYYEQFNDPNRVKSSELFYNAYYDPNSREFIPKKISAEEEMNLWKSKKK